jgi:hypothetical protein
MLFVADKLLLLLALFPPITISNVSEMVCTVREICWSIMSFALSTISSNFSSASTKKEREEVSTTELRKLERKKYLRILHSRKFQHSTNSTSKLSSQAEFGYLGLPKLGGKFRESALGSFP